MTQYVPGMLTCEEVDSFLYDFYEGQLSYSEKIKFKLHLSMCTQCKAYVQGYKNTVNISKKGFKKAKPLENIPEELIDVILKSRNKK
jgi:predicted anti-sigma-YlaC factor YlaD